MNRDFKSVRIHQVTEMSCEKHNKNKIHLQDFFGDTQNFGTLGILATL